MTLVTPLSAGGGGGQKKKKKKGGVQQKLGQGRTVTLGSAEVRAYDLGSRAGPSARNGETGAVRAEGGCRYEASGAMLLDHCSWADLSRVTWAGGFEPVPVQRPRIRVWVAAEWAAPAAWAGGREVGWIVSNRAARIQPQLAVTDQPRSGKARPAGEPFDVSVGHPSGATTPCVGKGLGRTLDGQPDLGMQPDQGPGPRRSSTADLRRGRVDRDPENAGALVPGGKPNDRASRQSRSTDGTPAARKTAPHGCGSGTSRELAQVRASNPPLAPLRDCFCHAQRVKLGCICKGAVLGVGKRFDDCTRRVLCPGAFFYVGGAFIRRLLGLGGGLGGEVGQMTTAADSGRMGEAGGPGRGMVGDCAHDLVSRLVGDGGSSRSPEMVPAMARQVNELPDRRRAASADCRVDATLGRARLYPPDPTPGRTRAGRCSGRWA